MLVISGLIGSGTSLLAQLAHETGVVMGSLMDFTFNGVQLEWEDRDFSHTLSRWAMNGIEVDDSFLDEYLEARKVQHGRLSETFVRVGFGVKTPLALLYRPELEAAAERAGLTLVWLLTDRDPAECWQAILRKIHGMKIHSSYNFGLCLQLFALQEMVKRSNPSGFDRISFESLVHEPEKVRQHISERMA